jgi:uncharacterized membrane protein YgdD (TMEM256/DUF423 family)
MTAKLFLSLGALLAGLGVAAGAFGAHGLSDDLSPDRMAVYETAVRYHLVHALALLIAGVLTISKAATLVTVAGYLFLAGVFIFSGSLYLLVLTDTPWLGAITPIGGVAWIVGWGLLALGVWKSIP